MIDNAQLVVAVWMDRSLTAAAERLGLSVATVSRRLAEIEREFGIVLFERSTRSLRVTAAGHELALRFERGLAEIDDALRLVRDEAEEPTGTVRVSVPPGVGPSFAPMLARFRTAFPAIRLHIPVTGRRISFADEDIDVLVRGGEVEEEDLVSRTLTTCGHVLCATKATAQKVLRPEELLTIPSVMWSYQQRRYPWKLANHGDAIELEPEPILQTDDYLLISEVLELGEVVGELPVLVAHPLLASARLVRVLPDWQLPPTPLSILYSSRLLPKSVRVFVDHLQQEFVELNKLLGASNLG